MKRLETLKLYIFSLAILLLSISAVTAAILVQANEVSYTNQKSKENAQNIKEALDELYKLSKTNCPEGYICTLESKGFEEDDWETISTAVKSGNISNYHVGDIKEIDMGTLGKHKLRIANTTTPAECKTEEFSQTACGFVLEFTDIISSHNMNPSGEFDGKQYAYGWNIGGFPSSSMHTYLQNDVYNALPKELRDIIIETTVVSSHGTDDTSNFTSNDKIYLLAPKEVYGTSFTDSNDTATNTTRQLDYYYEQGVTTTNFSGASKLINNNGSYWWFRSAYAYPGSYFYSVHNDGHWNNSSAYYSRGVSPAFRI